jgi:hyperosmotically inducible protein
MMSDTFPNLRVAVLLAAAVLSAAGCGPRSDADIARTLQVASAGNVAKGGEDAIGTYQTVEDSELTTSVRAAILADPQLQSQYIVVDTEDAAVTLTGIVDSPALRERAVQLAGSIDGVAQVLDKLQVRA